MKKPLDIIPELDVESPRCLVLGAGRSGVAAVRVLDSFGAHSTLVDSCDGEKLQAKVSDLGLRHVELAPESTDIPDGHFDLCVVSPAIPQEHQWLRSCVARDIPVIAEMELGYAFWQGRVIAVTGSKGKSSVVKLCADTLTAAGHKAVACGNYGVPLCEVAMDSSDAEWAIAETSSFQLEHTRRFRPDIAILLNLQADHLDRHGTMSEYARMKLRLFENQTEDDVALLPCDVDTFGNDVPGKARRFSFGTASDADWRYDGAGHIHGSFLGETAKIDFSGTWFDNPILGLAASCASAALFCGSLKPDSIAAGFRDFSPLPHRMQHVVESNGIIFIDDSKATSLAATAAAVKMTARPILLIAGGRLKEKNLSFIKDLLSKKVKKVYLIGECEKSLFTFWNESVACQMCHTMGRAVREAAADAEFGDAVLLSPGCASFDQFTSYGERGICFARLANDIAASAVRMEKK